MNSFFLYRLYKHSKFTFVFAIIFIVVYSICISKKMDMLVFPYNNMFSNTNYTNKTATTYFVKVNDKIMPYTHFMYWKKDFSEQALYNYACYIKNNNINYLESYIDQKISNKNKSKWLNGKLVPDSFSFTQWASWYASFTNNSILQNQKLELVEYKINFTKNIPFIVDSSTITSTIKSTINLK